LVSATLIQAKHLEHTTVDLKKTFSLLKTKINRATFTARSLCLGYFETGLMNQESE